MRIYETALWIMNLALIIGCVTFFGKHKRSLHLSFWAAALSGGLSLIQMITEGYRWQMIPAYAGCLIVGGLALYHLRQSTHSKDHPSVQPAKQFAGMTAIKRWITALLLLVYIGVSAALPSLLPVFSFAKLQGPYPVGTTTMVLEDERREEPATDDPADHRKLMIQIWYPASPGTGTGPSPYIEHLPVVLEGLQQAISIPPLLLGQLKYVQPHSTQDAELSTDQDRYPVLLFSHGLTGFRNQNTFQVEELASRGYVVVGIDHAYDAAAVVYPDHTAMLKLENLSGFDAYEKKSRLWVEDAKFVLDQIELLNESDHKGILSDRLDMDKVGMFGHSFGGATAAQMLLADNRVKAALNMDGTLYGQPVPEGGYGKPYMQMNAELSIDRLAFERSLDQAMESSGRSREDYEQFWAESADRRQRAGAGEAYSVEFAHANHMSFTDFYLFSPLLPPTGAAPRQMHRSINELSSAFFDRYVKGDSNVSLEKVADGLPHVTMP
ncbi:acetylhydrolase [Paenibacillus sp. MDMC362]|uniref:alpha/beta hydrolase family protein n=1 Tax=Paenibacillus sp. MDMC362 TaxID=2977365 RepID=UPI000DC4492B|nr:acetylhydrolase [Paenibacillus sp. MDMC362]RAR44680.1 acetylhydrolase [Paenibacillus sp. MDMC362]